MKNDTGKKIEMGQKGYKPHTDLALEERERFEDNVEINGVKLQKRKVNNGAVITTMTITTDEGANVMGKPKGMYVTIESKDIASYDSKNMEEVVANTVKKVIEATLKSESDKKVKKMLVVGLGNINATPDALGPQTISRIMAKDNVICIAPGVQAQTGMDSLNVIKGIVSQEKPDIVIALDSLAARNAKRVASTVQITDTGIVPGSGIGNQRMGLSKETLGVPIVAIGVPMVISSATIVGDTMDQLIRFLARYEEFEEVANIYEMFERDEKIKMIEEITDGGNGSMYVTPKDVDEIICNLSGLLSRAINMLALGMN